MRTIFKIAFCFFVTASLEARGQDSLTCKGQLSAWTHINSENILPWWNGARYIPQINYELKKKDDRLLDFEASANLYGTAGLQPFDSISFDCKIKPYRVWARYSTDQFELRAGLQKINFGSASMLRPLMWFDQIDPRDPLQLTDGVWGILMRYYFLNNANLWLWGLYGNNNTKGWETLKTKKNAPEFGGRLQYPVPGGEAAVSYHHRKADCSSLSNPTPNYQESSENRFGFDVKLDIVIGCWFEASWTNMSRNCGNLTNQRIINVGADYTFKIGNGLTATFEQLVASCNEKAFKFDNSITFSLLSLAYPVGLFDNLNAIVYYDWTNNKIYNFLNWQRQYNKFSLYLMGYINPKDYNIPTQPGVEKLYAGAGVQVMVVYNY